MSRRRPTGKAVLLGAAIAVVMAAAAAAIWVMDSPAEERERRLDERRVRDLDRLDDAVDVYWTRHGELPPGLEVLAAGYGLAEATTDPATGEPYLYRPGSDEAYEMCATFTTRRPEPGDDRTYDRFWNHPVGEHCFSFTAETVRP